MCMKFGAVQWRHCDILDFNSDFVCFIYEFIDQLIWYLVSSLYFCGINYYSLDCLFQTSPKGNIFTNDQLKNSHVVNSGI